MEPEKKTERLPSERVTIVIIIAALVTLVLAYSAFISPEFFKEVLILLLKALPSLQIPVT